MKILKLIIAVLIIGVLLSSCSWRHSISMRFFKHKPCTVQFKRNLLGSTNALPVSSTTTGISSVDGLLTGNLMRIEKDAVVVSTKDKVFWIPRDSILYIEWTK